MVLYCSGIMYKYYSCLGFLPIKHNQEGKDIHNEIFNNIPHFVKKCLNANCLQYGFVMYNKTVTIFKSEVILPIPVYMIQDNLCQNNDHVINFTTNDMRSKFEAFSKNKLYALYRTESTRTEWIQNLYELWDEVDKPYSYDLDLWKEWLFQY